MHPGTPPVPAASSRACETDEKRWQSKDERSGAEVSSGTPERRRRGFAARRLASTTPRLVRSLVMALLWLCALLLLVVQRLVVKLGQHHDHHANLRQQNSPRSAEDAGHAGIVGPVAGCGGASWAIPTTPRQLGAPRRRLDGQPGVLAAEAALLVHLASPPPSTNGGHLAANNRAILRSGRSVRSLAPMGEPETPLCEVSLRGSGEAAVRRAELHVHVRHLLLTKSLRRLLPREFFLQAPKTYTSLEPARRQLHAGQDGTAQTTSGERSRSKVFRTEGKERGPCRNRSPSKIGPHTCR
ncbi:uncharacterized protein METZ01_LOCUS209923 [marine metagenome]|uniref:Uncharacterized protein n=1 Tax=marine metagenome TaxID=408172 RepID=A0A382F300_9ZZZZ